MTDIDIEVVDLLIIGGGTAGLALARATAGLGDRVVLVERGELGGTAAHFGDLPLATLRGLIDTGEHDLPTLRRGIAAARTQASAAIGDELAGIGVEVITGSARFVAPRQIFVSRAARTLTAARIVLALGTEPDLPSLPGLIDALPLTTASALALRELPGSLLVIGGGASGIELATVLATLGVSVTLVEREPQLLVSASPEIAAEIAQRLSAAGVSVRTGHAVGAVMRRPDGRVQSTLADGTKIMTDELLVASGRLPATAGLGLDLAGVRLTPDGHPVTDAQHRTTAPGIWALGEVTGTSHDSASAAAQHRALLTEPAPPVPLAIAAMTVWTTPPVHDVILRR